MLIKKKAFWSAIISLIFAVGIAIFNTRLNPGTGVIDKLENSINTRNEKKILSLFEPSLRKELKNEPVLNNIVSSFNLDTQKHRLEIIYGNRSVSNGLETYRAVFLTTLDGNIENADVNTVFITEYNGKKYISNFGLK